MTNFDEMKSAVVALHGNLSSIVTQLEREDMLDRIDPRFSDVIPDLEFALTYMDEAISHLFPLKHEDR